MNLNIIDYIVDEKKFTQAQIAEKMSAAGDVKGQVSQAQISRWKNPKNTMQILLDTMIIHLHIFSDNLLISRNSQEISILGLVWFSYICAE